MASGHGARPRATVHDRQVCEEHRDRCEIQACDLPKTIRTKRQPLQEARKVAAVSNEDDGSRKRKKETDEQGN